MAARVRPRAAPGPLPRQGARLQRLPAQGRRARTPTDGREIVRPLDPWPHSEAGRFHRGIVAAARGARRCSSSRSAPRATTRPPRPALLAGAARRRTARGPLAAARLPRPPGRLPGAVGLDGSRPMSPPPTATPRSRWASQNPTRSRRDARRRRPARRGRPGRARPRRARPARVRARGRVPPRPAAARRGPGLVAARPAGRPHGARRPAHGDAHDPAPGGHHARQRPGPRGGGLLLPHRRRGGGDHADRGVRARHVADRPDDAALRARRRRPRPAAGRARAAQRGAAADHRRADRALGHQGLDRGDQGRRDPRGDAARHGAPGRGRARAPREDHQRRGRVPGGRASSPAPPRSSAREPPALHLRYLQTLLEVGADQSSTIVFPLPLDLLEPFLGTVEAAAGRDGVSVR